MLEFRSANTRAVNPHRAVMEAFDLAYGDTSPDCDLVLMNSAMGHDLTVLSENVRSQCPNARVLVASCAGVVGRDGPGESLHDIAALYLRGDGFSVAHIDGLFGSTSFEKGVELATGLLNAPYPVRMVYLLASGIDIANDRLIAGIESVLGPDVVLFGATSSDQMQGIATFQCVDGVRYRHGAFAVGIWDPTLTVDTQASHGFVAVGEPFVVTKAAGNRIFELDGKPAWPTYTERLGLSATATTGDTIPIGALAELLPGNLAAEYGNPHILRVVTHFTEEGALVYATECENGTQLWLTVRDEDRIFCDMDRMLGAMTARSPGAPPVVVFQADCLARGRRLLNRVMKEELVRQIQQPFESSGDVPPWFGMYGFGEYARLGGRNAYHNYTTALAALYRSDQES
ncbi:MAG: FIST N-terminal domain-containing protein [Capsulimonadales bacterium]|nr:FIST N-terminal domain-containing protein [Capsulimonadales bacterium]